MSGEKSNQPLISIAVCTYNGENHLIEQLESLIHQTYQNLEIIIVDDCSTDNTYQILKSYQHQYPNIFCFENAENIGYNKNFEKALLLCNGSFIAISDQDDIWELNKIEELYNHIGDNWLIYSNSALIDEKGREIKKDLFLQENQVLDYKGILLSNYITGHTMMLKKSFVLSLPPLPKIGYYDWYIGMIALYEKKVTFLNSKLTKYRIHQNSVTNKLNKSNNNDHKFYEVIVNQLNYFLSYPNLKKKDFSFILKIKNTYETKMKKSFSFILFKTILLEYATLFPNSKKRNLLSRINFARRFSYGLKSSI